MKIAAHPELRMDGVCFTTDGTLFLSILILSSMERDFNRI